MNPAYRFGVKLALSTDGDKDNETYWEGVKRRAAGDVKPEESEVTPAQMDGLKGTGALIGGAAAGMYARPLITGRTRLYHGTTGSNAAKIRQEGLRPSSQVGGPAITDVLAPDLRAKAKDLVYLTHNPMEAGGYAGQAKYLANGGKPTDAVGREVATGMGMMNPGGKGVAVADVPLWREDIKAKLRPNPEARGSYQEYVAGRGPFAKIVPGEDVLKAEYNSFLKSKAFDGGLDAKWFHGAPNYQGVGLKEVGQYARQHPGRFAGGIGLAGIGLAAGAYGANKLYHAFRGTANKAEAPQEAPVKQAGFGLELAQMAGHGAASAYAAHELSGPEHRTRNAILGGIGGALIQSPVTGALGGALAGERLMANHPGAGRALGGLAGGALGGAHTVYRIKKNVEKAKEQIFAVQEVMDNMHRAAEAAQGVNAAHAGFGGFSP